MDIVILADFCGRFNKEGNSRFLYLAKILCENHSVEVITSDFNHGTKDYFKSVPEGFAYKITMLHESAYKKNICLSRFKAHYTWGKNVAAYLAERKKPDVIYCAVPTLKASYEAAKYCEKNNIRFVIDIQDLWPEAFQMVFHVPILSNLIFAPFKYLADGIYRRADEICAVSQTYVNRALRVNKKCRNGHCVFLGTRLETFDTYAKKNPILKKQKDERWLAYCGTLGNSYDIECVIEALYLVKEQGIVPPRFIIMGDGVKSEELRSFAKEKRIEAQFTGMLPYDQMCALLCECDMTVNPIVDNSAASIINKHGDYAACGLPVLNTQNSEEYRKLVADYEMGLNSDAGNAEELAKNIRKLLENPDLRKKMGDNARKCAEEKFDRKESYQIIVKNLAREEFTPGGGLEKIVFKPFGEFWIAYCGTLGNSYDLGCIIDAIGIIKDRYRIRLIVMGDGPQYEKFLSHAIEKKISYFFTGMLPYDRMCGLLCVCDLVVNPISHGAAQSIINKHADYAASGLPVLSTQECAEYQELVENYNMGFNCKNGNAKDLAYKIYILLQNVKIREQMGKNARKCAEEKFDRKNSYDCLIKQIEVNNQDIGENSYEI